MGLNERQIKAVLYVKEKGKITNSQYQKLCQISKPTATRDLQELESRNVFINKGTKGSSSAYELRQLAQSGLSWLRVGSKWACIEWGGRGVLRNPLIAETIKGVEKIIRTLKQEDRLRRIGPDKGGHWEVC